MKSTVFGVALLASLLAATMPSMADSPAVPSANLAGGTGAASEAPASTGTQPTAKASPDAQPAVAASSSDIDKVGQIIIGAVDGRSLQQALDAGGSSQNPFGLDADPLLLAAGVYFISSDSSGAPIDKSEFSIFPDYVTPGAKYEPSEATPPIMPFAFNRGGTCFGGYVTGYPVPNKVEPVDMTGKACSAKTVDDAVGTQYAAAGTVPADKPNTADTSTPTSTTTVTTSPDNGIFDGTSASDHDLEMIVYGAYTGAYNQAVKHQNYFNSSDFPYPQLRSAVRDALDKEGYGAANVETASVATAAAAKACASDGKIDLRFAFNNAGIGVVVVAVSDKRMSAYEYDPSKSSDLVITHADDCLAAGSPAGDDVPDRLSTPAH